VVRHLIAKPNNRAEGVTDSYSTSSTISLQPTYGLEQRSSHAHYPKWAWPRPLPQVGVASVKVCLTAMLQTELATGA